MKKVHIREKSPVWYVMKFRKPLLVAGLACICYMGMTAVDTALAQEPELEVPQVPQVPEVVEIIEEEPVKLWDVPLDEDLQKHIAEVGKMYGIEPKLILAVIGQESSYIPETVGDNGNSQGLMQVQSRWHLERMGELGCYDLMNPYENIIVGTDYLAELMEKYGDIEKALMCYNAGESGAKKLYFNKGIVSNYAKEVLARYEELMEE